MIALRAVLQRRRRQLLAAVIASLLGVLVAWAHSGAGGGHMAMDDEPLGEAVAVCLAVFPTAGGLIAGALAIVAARTRRWTPPARITARRDRPAPRPTPARARAGPALLQVLLR